MTYKDLQKLMGLVQYAPKEKQDEYAMLLAKAATTKSIQKIDNRGIAEKGLIPFTKKEISTMPDDIQKLFIVNN